MRGDGVSPTTWPPSVLSPHRTNDVKITGIGIDPPVNGTVRVLALTRPKALPDWPATSE